MENSFSHDVLSEIFSHLPAKSVAKLCATNKHLTSNYTSDDFFFLSQAKNCKTDSGFFITNSCSTEIFFLDPHAGIPQESIKLLEKTPKILASSNGLIFCKKEKNAGEKSICVYNLVHKTQCFVPSDQGEKNLSEVPLLGLSVVYYGDFSADYKLVCLIADGKDWSDQFYVRLYDSRRNEWINLERAIYYGPRTIKFESSVVIRDNIFWASDCRNYFKNPEKYKPYIFAFNIESGVSRFLCLPDEVSVVSVVETEAIDISISKKDDDSLCLVKFCKTWGRFTVWTMKIDNIAPKWKIVSMISLAEMGLKRKNEISSFELMKGGEILVFVMGFKAVYAYNFKDGMVKKIGETGLCYATLVPYANTLRPCGKYGCVETY